MAKIYHRNQKTLAWLGDGEPDSRRVTQAVDHVLADMRETTELVEFQLQPDDDARPLLDAIPAENRHFVQEVALAPAAVCIWGDCKLQVSDVLKVGFRMFANVGRHDVERDDIGGFSAAMDLWDFAGMEQGSWGFEPLIGDSHDLLSLLLLAGRRGKTDSRDSIFAVLGLPKYGRQGRTDAFPPLPKPDYMKTLAHIFRDAALFLIQESQTLELFTGRLTLPSDLPDRRDMPSWAPCIDAAAYESGTMALPPRFDADNGERLSIRPSKEHDDPSILELRGYACGSIVATAGIFEGDMYETTYLQYLRSAQTLLQHHREGTSEAQARHIVAATMVVGTLDLSGCGDGGLPRRQPVTVAEAERYLQAFETYIKRHGILPSLVENPEGRVAGFRWEPDEELVEMAARFKSSFEGACENRRFFVTDSGSACFEPATAAIDDVVVVLFGSKVPIVLRAAGGMYNLVGPYYAHDAMSGEMVRQQQGLHNPCVVFGLQLSGAT